MFYFCWCCLFFPSQKFQRFFFFLLHSHKVMVKQSSAVSVWGRKVCEHDRERMNRAGWKKKHRKLRWDQNWIWGEMQFSNDISIIYNQFEAKLHPRAESSSCPQNRREKRKNKRQGRAGNERKEKEKSRFWEGQLWTWPGTGLGGVALQQGWAGAHRLCRSRAHLLPPPCPAQHLPLPSTPQLGLLICCLLPAVASTATCFSFLFSFLMHEAEKWRKTLRNSFPCWVCPSIIKIKI